MRRENKEFKKLNNMIRIEIKTTYRNGERVIKKTVKLFSITVFRKRIHELQTPLGCEYEF
jgi:hypothetical protein